MMLRSSSTPLLGSLLSSISSDSLNNNHHHHHHETTLHPYKFSFHQTLSCHSSPISPSFGHGGLQRAQSEGNLESLLNSGNGGCYKDDNLSKKHSSRLHSSFLETIPSFSNENSRNGDESIDNEEQEEEEEEEEFYDFNGFNRENKVLSLNKQMGFGDLAIKDDLAMYLAKEIGVDAGFGCGDGGDAGTGGGGRNLSQVGGGGCGDNHDTEEHYRKMVNDNPGNSLFFRNYAQFLYQSKQDLQGAEEYYSRAILVDPNDGEILSQYAKLLWELHHDKDRATSYFERAVQAASKDSHVHAAYASFLWEVEGDEDREEEEGYYSNIPTLFNNGKLASAATA